MNYAITLLSLVLMAAAGNVRAAVTELNSSGGTSATNGLHFYLEDTSKLQVRRLNNTGQVYLPTATPPSTSLDNGIFLRADGALYGPSHAVGGTFNPGAMYDTFSITAASPANPAIDGIPQAANQVLGVNAGPQINIQWRYTRPYDFITLNVTLTIPAGYAVSAANPVKYYHVVDTYLGGSDSGCGLTFVDSSGKRIVGTYPPPSGNNCPSSSSIPAGVSIVESFRERNGAFSHYCTDTWNTFYDNAAPWSACALKSNIALSDSVSATYRDTGVGIEYDFTAAGTYTFSYDFVIGSPTLPPYDHVEIRHDGSGSLCAENVTVLGCLSSIVPCPAGSEVTGALSGTFTPSGGTPSVTWTPASFNIAAGQLQTSASFLASAPGGTITLGAVGFSTNPLNGVKCWNTATSTASCTFVVANAPCVAGFECIESGVTYNNLVLTPTARNPLYTKPTATNFKFDVVALQSNGAIANAYTATQNVTVELFDDSAAPQPACSAYVNPVASQSITFAASDAGRKTLPNNFSLNKAYRKLRCRVTDSNTSPTVRGCSSDVFTVRPQAFTVTSSNANADNAGASATATPALKAGANFALIARTGVAGYDTTPKIDAARLEWLNVPEGGRASPGTGTVSGVFPIAVPSPSLPAVATDSVATGSAFTYDEVGYFRFQASGVYDDIFTVDSGDQANGDCTNDFSSSPVSGKYGCKFGNTIATNHFGRFIPDHFDTAVTQGCATGGFSYSGQPFRVTTTAMNLAGGITLNYDADAPGGINVYSKAATLSAWNAAGTTANPGPGTLTNNAIAALLFRSGVANTANPPTMASPLYTFTSLKTPPTIVKLRAIDAEGISSLRASPLPTIEGSTEIRSGRLRLQNAYGSELLDLPVPLEAQYWVGNYYASNTADNCTIIPASSIVMNNYVNNLSACETQLSPVGNLVFSGGKPISPGLKLTKPGSGNAGSVNLAVNISAAPTGKTCVGASESNATAANIPWFGANPASRATFGIYKTPIIYMRENY